VLDLFFGIMNLVVFYFISRTVALRSDTLDGAPTYFAFASVGIVLTVVMQAATAGLAARIREEQLTGTLEVLVMQPLTPTQLAFGLTGFPYLFGVIRGGLYIAFAALFLDLDLDHASVIGFLLILAATGMALAAIGIAMGALVLVFKQGTALAGVVTFGLGLLSGTLFPRELLPGWIQSIGDLLPTRFAVDGLRDTLFGGTGWHGDLSALTVTAAILLPLAILFFSTLLGVVKRSGSLSQY
jgi:ABC-type multidrug transport system permease subunit